MLRFCCCQGQDFSFFHLIQTSLPSHLSFGNWILFFQKESGWSIKLSTTSRSEFSIAVFPSFLGAKEARQEGVWTNICNVIWMFTKLEGVMPMYQPSISVWLSLKTFSKTGVIVSVSFSTMYLCRCS
jgi:hypothetical protein